MALVITSSSEITSHITAMVSISVFLHIMASLKRRARNFVNNNMQIFVDTESANDWNITVAGKGNYWRTTLEQTMIKKHLETHLTLLTRATKTTIH
jgi:hypothetical protein